MKELIGKKYRFTHDTIVSSQTIKAGAIGMITEQLGDEICMMRFQTDAGSYSLIIGTHRINTDPGIEEIKNVNV